LTSFFLVLPFGLIVILALPLPGAMVGAVMIGVVVVPAAPHVIAEIRERRRLFAWLGTLPPTTERITFRECNDLYASACSFGCLAVQLVFYGAVMLWVFWSAGELTSFARYLRFVFAAACALAATMMAFAIVLKWRQRRAKR